MYFISSVIQSHVSQFMLKIDGRCSESINAVKYWSATWSTILLQLRSFVWLRCETPHRPQCISKWYTIYWYGLHKIHTINKLCIDWFNSGFVQKNVLGSLFMHETEVIFLADSKFHSDMLRADCGLFQNIFNFKIRGSMDDDMNIFGIRLVYTKRKWNKCNNNS